jgi:hypothetical protein
LLERDFPTDGFPFSLAAFALAVRSFFRAGRRGGVGGGNAPRDMAPRFAAGTARFVAVAPRRPGVAGMMSPAGRTTGSGPTTTGLSGAGSTGAAGAWGLAG